MQTKPDGTEATLSEKLVRFVEHCSISKIPHKVTARARMQVLDYLGVALTGSGSRSSEIVADVVRQLGGAGDCTVIGRDYRTNAPMAALVNGTAGHSVEMDDDHRTAVLHPGVAVVPAALAAAEMANASGSALIEGVVAGYDVMTRIGDAFLGTQYYEGFHPTGTCGVFGAVAAAGRILGLSYDQLVCAFGIAGTQAAGLEEWKADGSWIKRLHPGKAAENGLLAALLAQAGYTGPATILEGEHGFLKAFSFERKWDTKKIVDGLGEEYRGFGTSFKPYAGCRFFHQVIDAVLSLAHQHDIKPSEISEVRVRIYRTAYLTLFQPEHRRYKPGTVVDAQFSIPYAVAVALLFGSPTPSHFQEEMIKDPRILQLAAKVKGVPDSGYEERYPARFPTEVTIQLVSGKVVSEYRDLPSGDPENPVYSEPGRFEDEIVRKFNLLIDLQPAYAGRREQILSIVNCLEDVKQVRELVALFTPAGN